MTVIYIVIIDRTLYCITIRAVHIYTYIYIYVYPHCIISNYIIDIYGQYSHVYAYLKSLWS